MPEGMTTELIVFAVLIAIVGSVAFLVRGKRPKDLPPPERDATPSSTDTAVADRPAETEVVAPAAEAPAPVKVPIPTWPADTPGFALDRPFGVTPAQRSRIPSCSSETPLVTTEGIGPIFPGQSLNDLLAACPANYTAWHFRRLCLFHLKADLQAEVPDPFLTATTLYHREPLHVAAMNEAAGHLTGPHDFSSFGRVPDPEATAERVLFELRCTRDGDLIRVRARANAFVQQMVRSLVGTLIQVGEGRTPPDAMPGVLAARDRCTSAVALPPVARLRSRATASAICKSSIRRATRWRMSARSAIRSPVRASWAGANSIG